MDIWCSTPKTTGSGPYLHPPASCRLPAVRVRSSWIIHNGNNLSRDTWQSGRACSATVMFDRRPAEQSWTRRVRNTKHTEGCYRGDDRRPRRRQREGGEMDRDSLCREPRTCVALIYLKTSVEYCTPLANALLLVLSEIVH